MRRTVVIALALSCLAQSARAQLPATQLESIFPAGASVGATVDVTLGGSDLDDAAELRFSHPGITAAPKLAEPTPFDDDPEAIPNQFVVTVAKDVPLGTYDVRTRGKYGLSNPRIFELSNLAELLETEPNNEPEQAGALTLPLIVNGQINRATDVDMFRFTASAGQRILFDCRARRIDSLLNPTLSVYDVNGRELVSNRDGFGSEPLVDFHVPVAGDYFLRVADAYFRGNANYVYRLTIGLFPYIDFVFPPAGRVGSTGQFAIFGRNLPGGKPSDVFVGDQRLEKLSVDIELPGDSEGPSQMHGRVEPAQAFLDTFEFQLKDGPLPSNPFSIGVTTVPLVAEAENNDTPQTAQRLSPPCEVAGKFYPSRDDDWYTFDAKKDDTYTIEVISHRLGLPTDPQLIVQQVSQSSQGEEQVKVLVTADDMGTLDRAQFDTRTNDASYRFVAAADATYRVTVRDGFSSLRTDPRLVYRLAIRQENPDFRLVAVPRDPWGALVLRQGDRTTVDVLAERRDGLAEPIILSVTGLPEGVSSAPVTLGPSMTVASLVLTAADDAAPAMTNLKIVGTAIIGGQEVTRSARCGTANTSMRILQPNQRAPNSLPARVSRNIGLAVVDGMTPFAMQIKNDAVWETSRAGVLKIPYNAVHRLGYKGQVRCEVANLPANINRTTFNIAANNAKGEFTLTLRSNTPPGIYTLHVGAFVTAYSYARNPEAAEVAKQRKAVVDKIAADAGQVANEAANASRQAEKLATDAAAAVVAAQKMLTQAKESELQAAAVVKGAEQAVAAATAAASAKPEDEALKNAVAKAKDMVVAAVENAKDAAAATEIAVKELAAAQSKSIQAKEQKAVADQQAADAKAFAQSATDEKKRADKRATDTANAAKPKNINYWTASTPVTIKIHEYPITLDALPAVTKLKQGEMTDLALTIKRLVGYQEQVNFTTVIRGVSGVTLKNVRVPKGQSQIKLPITAAANASPGTHEVTLRATMRVNNQTLTLDQTFNLEIEKVEPKK